MQHATFGRNKLNKWQRRWKLCLRHDIKQVRKRKQSVAILMLSPKYTSDVIMFFNISGVDSWVRELPGSASFSKLRFSIPNICAPNNVWWASPETTFPGSRDGVSTPTPNTFPHSTMYLAASLERPVQIKEQRRSYTACKILPKYLLYNKRKRFLLIKSIVLYLVLVTDSQYDYVE